MSDIKERIDRVKTTTCPECKGEGFIPEYEADSGYYMGRRRVGESRCGLCGGDGVIAEEGVDAVDPKVQAFADWLAEYPNGIDELRTLVSSARYYVDRTAHPPEDHKRVDVFSDLVKRLRAAA